MTYWRALSDMLPVYERQVSRLVQVWTILYCEDREWVHDRYGEMSVEQAAYVIGLISTSYKSHKKSPVERVLALVGPASTGKTAALLRTVSTVPCSNRMYKTIRAAEEVRRRTTRDLPTMQDLQKIQLCPSTCRVLVVCATKTTVSVL